MLQRKIDCLGPGQIRIFDYKMLSVMLMVGGISVFSLVYTLNRSCVADSQVPQAAAIDNAISRSISGVGISSVNIRQQSQGLVFKYSDGSEKVVALPSNGGESEIRAGIMSRHNAARRDSLK